MSKRLLDALYPKPSEISISGKSFQPPGQALSVYLPSGAPKWVRAAAKMVGKELGRSISKRLRVSTSRRLSPFTLIIAPQAEVVPKLAGPKSVATGTADQIYSLEIENDRILLRAGGWEGLGYGLMTLLNACEAGPKRMTVVDGPRFSMRAMLLHVSYNMWRHEPAKDVIYGFSDKLRFDKPVFDEAVALMARLKMNMVLLDMGDAVRYRSHPEIAVKGALTPAQVKRLVAQCRDLGLEPIPKLNFATTHDAWLKDYGDVVGTGPYWQVCEDLIAELTDLFDGPRLFHIGMDEETIEHCRGLKMDHIILREGKAWLDAVKRLDRIVRERGARTWMWGDPLWPDREGETPDIPKRILISDWNYGPRKSFPTSLEIEKLGYENVPTGANWTEDTNAQNWARFADKKLAPDSTPGLMMTVWNPTVRKCRKNILNAISHAAGAFWNPKAEARSDWEHDFYGGRPAWTRYDRPK